MNNVILRFPNLAQKIFEELNNKSLSNCRKVDDLWRGFVDMQKFTFVRKVQIQFENMTQFHEDLETVYAKTPVETLKKLTMTVDQFLRENPHVKKHNEHWSPLQFAAEFGYLELCQHLAILAQINQRRLWMRIPSPIDKLTT